MTAQVDADRAIAAARPTLRAATCFAVGVLVVLATLGEAWLAIAAFNACDIGVNAAANTASVLLLGAPALFLLNSAAVLAVVPGTKRLVRRRRDGAVLAAALTVLVVVGLLVWMIILTPAGYPDPICPENVPAWWPAWLPS